MAAAEDTRPSVYLASGLGFSARQRALVLPELKAALEKVSVVTAWWNVAHTL